ncbi:hypothetical protein [Acidocella aminolytica]|jgi:hypothetical protein|uniref:Uncharacterized protein n=1 Tax=Acidocella aminolytica 101 = DSM 11237 TaxID=1120923 RepID=A0A0D6PB57_9PROT|nr:hypothetical protein [Acidocella aminolytica]GAN78995.1 hypothetical protein Aam_015_005 [Acidocella aminolytica 101 = DSM 11237]GBQ38366.1 hypothetical protein AA11237_1773 [Acidocella aminolytica 101 = DSM 11237]SHF37371.1 hypothetical protein SAMN02746095_03013 [Acidocella aminolytica 101 = DSM 11237]
MKTWRTAVLQLTLSGVLSLLAYPALASGATNGPSANDSNALVAALGTDALPTSQLSKLRGASGFVGAVNIGTNTGNSADNSITGSISNTRSVNNNVGLTTVIQNTGNNALIQSSMTVNITVH